MKTSPCKNCEKRGCGRYHDECVEYQDYLSEKEAVKERKIKTLNLDRAFDEHIKNTKKAARQRGGKR